MCGVVRSRRDGLTIWLNSGPEPSGREFENCWDLVVRGECDDVARLANLPRWDDNEAGKFCEDAAGEAAGATEQNDVQVVGESMKKLDNVLKFQGVLTPAASPRSGSPSLGKLMLKKVPLAAKASLTLKKLKGEPKKASTKTTKGTTSKEPKKKSTAKSAATKSIPKINTSFSVSKSVPATKDTTKDTTKATKTPTKPKPSAVYTNIPMFPNLTGSQSAPNAHPQSPMQPVPPEDFRNNSLPGCMEVPDHKEDQLPSDQSFLSSSPLSIRSFSSRHSDIISPKDPVPADLHKVLNWEPDT
jgi:NAD-dependent histone deacetylase SIR2